MSVTVRIPTQLRTLTGGSGEVSVEGSTVGEVLKALDAAHAGFADRLFDESGELRVADTAEEIERWCGPCRSHYPHVEDEPAGHDEG